MSEHLRALRRADPRRHVDLSQQVEAVVQIVHRRIADEQTRRPASLPRRRRRVARLSFATVSLAMVTTAAVLAVGSLSSSRGVESAAAAVQKAATLTAASAEQSGTAEVRVTHDGALWAGKTIRWNGDDVAIRDETPGRDGGFGSGWLLVDGHLYGPGGPAVHGWIDFGSPSNIDPDSGTTPTETLAAVQQDVGGATVRRMTSAMTDLTQSQLADGSTVYSGTVRAGLIAPETDFKEGQTIRVFPFGYVAHDEAADPASQLDTALTVAPDGVVRQIAVTWGAGSSQWIYTVSYSNLGSTEAIVAPANAKSLRELRGMSH